MNERIKELAIQAGYVEDSLGFGHWERFAELIIQECADVASRADDDNEDYSAWYLIENHFGFKV